MIQKHLRMSAATAAGCAALILAISIALGFGGNNGTVCPKPVGPDVIIGDMWSTSNFSAETVDGIAYDAFSFGTTSCSVGNQDVRWNMAPNNRHPVMAQSLYRYKVIDGSGRFEQLGQSWLKHGFTVLTDNTCGCGCNGHGGSVLGVGCSDPYTAGRNASQSSIGPKWQVDASSGYFPAAMPANPPYSGTTARRLRVKSADLEPSSAAVRYFGACQFVTQDDAAFGNKDNNATYKEAAMVGGPTEWSISLIPPTRRETAVIMAWKAIDPAVTITNVTTVETPNPNATVFAPNPLCCSSALVVVGAKATNLGNGIYHYEYAIQNVNSDRSIASVTIPLSGPITVTNIGFHDVDYHSGDGIPTDLANPNTTARNFDGTDWPATINSNSITWATVPFDVDSNSNALRWGTTYNFRFDANAPPTTGNLTLGTYKVVGNLNASTIIPVPVPPCPSDVTHDGQVNVIDLLAVISNWGPCPERPAPCPADISGDGQVDTTDLLAIIEAWGSCPTPFAGGSGK